MWRSLLGSGCWVVSEVPYLLRASAAPVSFCKPQRTPSPGLPSCLPAPAVFNLSFHPSLNSTGPLLWEDWESRAEKTQGC